MFFLRYLELILFFCGLAVVVLLGLKLLGSIRWQWDTVAGLIVVVAVIAGVSLYIAVQVARSI